MHFGPARTSHFGPCQYFALGPFGMRPKAPFGHKPGPLDPTQRGPPVFCTLGPASMSHFGHRQDSAQWAWPIGPGPIGRAPLIGPSPMGPAHWACTQLTYGHWKGNSSLQVCPLGQWRRLEENDHAPTTRCIGRCVAHDRGRLELIVSFMNFAGSCIGCTDSFIGFVGSSIVFPDPQNNTPLPGGMTLTEQQPPH